jgi:hypothetical protein
VGREDRNYNKKNEICNMITDSTNIKIDSNYEQLHSSFDNLAEMYKFTGR